MQNSGPWDPWLPVVKTAEFSHSTGTARTQRTVRPLSPVVHSVYRLYSGKRAYAQCLQTMHNVYMYAGCLQTIKIRAYTHMRVHVCAYAHISGARAHTHTLL